MNKDVIYIDVEDDITAIVGKIKASKEKIVALVPPKRIGILQSAVNMRLLARSASNSGKRVVLITGNQALIALAAASGIPVARNLQSKPELAEIPAISVDDDDDIIDGASLPVGDIATAASQSPETAKEDQVLEGVNIEDEPAVGAVGAVAIKSSQKPLKLKINNKAQKSTKVPNFNSFRKKLFIGIAAAILLIGFIVWAIVYAPFATVVITAKTSPTTVTEEVTLANNQTTDASSNRIKSVSEQTQKEVSVEFTPTGEEDRGEKASGQVTLSIRCTDVESSPPTIPAGTGVSSGGKTFITQSTVELDEVALDPCRFTNTTAVTAQSNGSDYNLPSGASYTVAGFGDVSGSGSAMTGGVTKIVKIVTAADVQKASASLAKEEDQNVINELKDAFGANVLVIDESFAISKASPVSSPAVGQEAEGKATLTTTVTYSMFGIADTELKDYLEAVLSEELGESGDREIYESGLGDTEFSDFAKGPNNTATVQVRSIARIGPKIDEQQIKEQVKGRRFGDIQSSLQMIDGVSDVDVKFSYFWVRTVPNDTSKIKIEFKLEDA